MPKRALILLADADAFRSIGLDRRAALWAVRRLPDDVPLPLFEIAIAREQPDEDAQPLPLMPLPEQVVADYQTIRLSLKGHPMEFLRAMFAKERVVTCAAVCDANDRQRVRCAGVVLVRQRPGSAKGVVFMTLEDETGIANIVVWPKVMEHFRKEVMGARLILVEGTFKAARKRWCIWWPSDCSTAAMRWRGFPMILLPGAPLPAGCPRWSSRSTTTAASIRTPRRRKSATRAMSASCRRQGIFISAVTSLRAWPG